MLSFRDDRQIPQVWNPGCATTRPRDEGAWAQGSPGAPAVKFAGAATRARTSTYNHYYLTPSPGQICQSLLDTPVSRSRSAPLSSLTPHGVSRLLTRLPPAPGSGRSRGTWTRNPIGLGLATGDFSSAVGSGTGEATAALPGEAGTGTGAALAVPRPLAGGRGTGVAGSRVALAIGTGAAPLGIGLAKAEGTRWCGGSGWSARSPR